MSVNTNTIVEGSSMRDLLVAWMMSTCVVASFAAEPAKEGERGPGGLILKNAKITLGVSCQAKPGESVLFLAD